MIAAFEEGHYASALKMWKALQRAVTKPSARPRSSRVCRARGSRRGCAADRPGSLPRPPCSARDMASASPRPGDDRHARRRLHRCADRPVVEAPLARGGDVARARDREGRTAVRRALYDATKEPFAVEAQRELRLATAAEISATLPDPALCIEALDKLEPPPADREVLALRVRCYRRAGHPRAAAARRTCSSSSSATLRSARRSRRPCASCAYVCARTRTRTSTPTPRTMTRGQPIQAALRHDR